MSHALTLRIQEEMKAAMRAQDKVRLSTIRLLLAAIKQSEIDDRKTPTDEDVIRLIKKMIKQRQDAATQYEAGKRPDLAEKELQEITLLTTYLPAAPSDTEITAAIETAIKTTNASTLKDLGKVMGILKNTLLQADMRTVSEKVKTYLK